MDSQETIRVMVVDDHAVVRRGLATFLLVFPDLELVAEAEDGAQAISLCAELMPDVVLMDLVMPEMDGVAATRVIRERFPEIQVLALTSYKDREKVTGALQAGAIGYLLKDISAGDLANAIRQAHAGRPALAPEAAEALVAAVSSPEESQHTLSERERQVLAGLVEGLSNREIARQLAYSQSTIKLDIQSIFQKLGVKNRTEAVAEAIKHHLVD